MSQVFNWNGNSIKFGNDIFGYVCDEPQFMRWGWSLTTHAEGRNEPAVLAEGHKTTKHAAMLACSAAYMERSKT